MLTFKVEIIYKATCPFWIIVNLFVDLKYSNYKIWYLFQPYLKNLVQIHAFCIIVSVKNVILTNCFDHLLS